MTKDELKQMIKEHEGLQLTVYHDSGGNPTVGYGHNLTVGTKITQMTANQLFEDDFRNARLLLYRLKGDYDLPNMTTAREGVLVDMLFNMGYGGVSQFKKMLAALQAKDCSTAADEMLDSKWAKQVGYRAVELSNIMREGEKTNDD